MPDSCSEFSSIWVWMNTPATSVFTVLAMLWIASSSPDSAISPRGQPSRGLRFSNSSPTLYLYFFVGTLLDFADFVDFDFSHYTTHYTQWPKFTSTTSPRCSPSTAKSPSSRAVLGA